MENVTASTNRLSSVTGVHLFKIAGHSLINGTDLYIMSKTFRIGGHDWAIQYYPYGQKQKDDGNKEADGEHASVFLYLMDAAKGNVRANYWFSLQDPASPATGEKNKRGGGTTDFSSKVSAWGYRKFVSKADLAASGCIKDDCLVIKCTIEVITSEHFDDHGEDAVVAVPPSELINNVGGLLDNGLKADMTVKIGLFKRFKVHACILAAQSPVFRAQLCGSMLESRRSSIRIKDVDATVFEVLLHYMYKDSLPAFMEESTEEATNMAQHLLVTADRYAIERLKLLCANKLSKTLDVNNVGFTLDFAERNNCQQLKDCCVKYMVRDRKRFTEIMKTKGFMQLTQNYGSLGSEIIDKAFAN
ncbi:BTB/POZ and MATH domain-containing protein 1-like [Hordeum vulgare subsp. vulgare]|uniref:BTB/POZ and MATH domain-containing protein 1-like n=1 Tax=Hordeum vulgare subsp. vulgare TaxID=112509 RepID=UPI001D1A3E56|nr:BTB/POZ and MATH domain-containing protein 1-like [Hordeum vulgare subsp. vulgare]